MVNNVNEIIVERFENNNFANEEKNLIILTYALFFLYFFNVIKVDRIFCFVLFRINDDKIKNINCLL